MKDVNYRQAARRSPEARLDDLEGLLETKLPEIEARQEKHLGHIRWNENRVTKLLGTDVGEVARAAAEKRLAFTDYLTAFLTVLVILCIVVSGVTVSRLGRTATTIVKTVKVVVERAP